MGINGTSGFSDIKSKDGQSEDCFPIHLSNLRTETVCDFDLYLQTDPKHPPVLYRDKSLVFTDAAKERLKENMVAMILVPSSQSKAYYHYIEDNLKSILQDPQMPVEQKSELLYSSSMNMVKDVLEEPRAEDVLPRTKSMVQNSISFLFQQENALQNLLRVASFDYYTYTHSVNVLVFSVVLAKRLGFSEEEIQSCGNGTLLHDVGKSMIDPEIVNFRGKLSKDQFAKIKKHAAFSYDVLLKQGVNNKVMLDVARHHHEKLTGKGYPDGLGPNEISEFARIATIADIFDALTTRRSYKEAMRTFESLKLMQTEMRNDLDPDIFQTFVEMMGKPGS